VFLLAKAALAAVAAGLSTTAVRARKTVSAGGGSLRDICLFVLVKLGNIQRN
jgi:hypothetical protein